MKIAIYGKRIDASNKKEIEHLLLELSQRNVDLLFHDTIVSQMKKNGLESFLNGRYFSQAKDIKSQGVDFLISIGGDGTFLDTILLIQEQKIPVLGINTGRLGFLSNTAPAEIKTAIEALCNKNYTIEERSMLEMDSESKLFGNDNQALNDISILRSDSSSMITIEVKLDGKHLNTYWADGLIIATATGSTAYSLSCGGPIIMPGSGNFVITPVAPHNLNVRPIVISAESKLEIEIESRTNQYILSCDSQNDTLQTSTRLQISRAPFQVHLIRLASDSFFSTLREKLLWGLDVRNY